MERSLSVLLPIRNAQSTLAGSVGELLDVLPDLTKRFEVLIIDDGSNDATIEVADELAAAYPQVRVIRHGERRGRVAAILTGLQRSHGDVVFLQDEGCGLATDDIGRLWRAMDEHELVLGRPRTVPEPYLSRWRRPAAPSPGRPGCQMAHRRVLGSLEGALADQNALRERLQRLGYCWHEVELRDRRASLSRTRQTAASRAGTTPSPLGSQGPRSRPRSPNYFAKLRQFALGE